VSAEERLPERSDPCGAEGIEFIEHICRAHAVERASDCSFEAFNDGWRPLPPAMAAERGRRRDLPPCENPRGETAA
jgi:hypothetical protein